MIAFLLGVSLSFAAETPKPRLAVVIDDFGLTYPKDQPDEDWMKLSWPVTFAVMPESPRTRQAAARSKETGHELIIHFPFDPFLSLALPKDKASEEDLGKVRKLLEKSFDQILGPKGLNNHRSYKATKNAPLMAEFMKLLKPKGVYFLDSWVGPKSVAYAEARKAGIPAAVNSIFLDGTHEPKGRKAKDLKVLADAIAKDKAVCIRCLRTAAKLARKNGHSVAIGHHYFHGTYECLIEEVPKLQADGFEFVFASALAR
ncbi:MAG: divergent polysaccharide deacetylase family protein [Elusimicrobia bacterium]|nr:divergent polysaccharide deacetylase family protein [Elusimicrobiota bacterium]